MMRFFEIVDGEAENLKYAINNPMKTTKIEMNCLGDATMKQYLLRP